MKNCPFCRELIQDDAIKCRYCGEFLSKAAPPQAQFASVKPGQPAVAPSPLPKNDNIAGRAAGFLLFGFLFGAILIGILSDQKPSFPYASIIVTGSSAYILFLSIKRMKLNRKKYLSLAAFIFPVLLIGLGLISTEYEKYKNNQESEKVAKAAATKRQEKNELEIKYNQVHKEEHYQSALTLIKENNYKDAKEMLGKVSSVDDNYKDIKALRADLDEKILRAENEKRIADANQGLIDAEKLLRSDSCSDINTAISKIEYALKVLPSSKKAKEILQKASLNKLRCYQGNGQVLMAIQIQDYEPLKLHVWIKNVSSAVRHANPNHFTLVTVDGRSYSVSTKTYGLSSYFDAVDLQPGTETSGNIVFDTYAKPKKLVYSELLGTSISRDFPFQ